MSIEELYQKVMSDDGLQKAFFIADEEGKLGEFLTANGCNATVEEAKAFLASKKNKSGELNDDELDQVAGGCGDDEEDTSTPHKKQISTGYNGHCDYWACRLCYKRWSSCRCPYPTIAHVCQDCRYFLEEDGRLWCTL